MMTIWEYPLQIVGEQDLSMPRSARILSVQVQGDALCLWALVDPTENVLVTRRFHVIGTGHTHSDALFGLTYLGTAQMGRGQLVWHVFEEER